MAMDDAWHAGVRVSCMVILYPWISKFMYLQVYEKKVSSLTNFNIENRGVPNSGVRVNALNTPRLTQALHLPKVCL